LLRPKKHKVLLPEIAKEFNVSADLVNDVISHYWSTVRESLSRMKSIRVHVTNLGDFTAKHWLIDKQLESLENFEEDNNLKGFQKVAARYKNAEKIYDLNQLKRQVADEQQRKEFIDNHKKTRNETKQGESSESLEE
jgi:hypothetical protein